MQPIPRELHGLPFTRQQALTLGVTDRMLRGRRFVRIVDGIYRTVDTPDSQRLMNRAALLAVPGAALSHTTALSHLGLELAAPLPLHLSTSRPVDVRRQSIIRVHRYQVPAETQKVDGLRTTDPYRTFVDCATILGRGRLLAVGDWLANTGRIDPARLRQYVESVHFDGVRRARQVAPHLNPQSASVRESIVRWLMADAGLPEQAVNADIYTDDGTWIARGDLVLREYRVVVEYDGWQHERDAQQRQWDHLRREQLEAAGWRVIVITTHDLRSPRSVVLRISQALRGRYHPS